MITSWSANTIAEYMILLGADNLPQCWTNETVQAFGPTIEENGVTKTKKYAELSATEKIQADCDLKATNIILKSYIGISIHLLIITELQELWERNHTNARFAYYQTCDQLHAYLATHELLRNESVSMRSTIQFQQQFSPSQSSQYGSIHTTQHYSFTHPCTHLEISYPSTPYPNTFTSTVHQDPYPQPQSVP
ncbi:hypothetical protein Tco_0472772 [Tanacetum coccineum]